jgi:hypothetical protein
VAPRVRSGTLRGLRGPAATGREWALTDTPIYDQIRQELEGRAGRNEPLTARRSRSDESDQAVSVWALVNQHRNTKPR